MNEQQQKSFRFVIAVSVVGIIATLLAGYGSFYFLCMGL